MKLRKPLVAFAAAAAVFAAFSGAESALAKKKGPKEFFKSAFTNAPKVAKSFSAQVKGDIGEATGFYHDDVSGALVLNGISQKAKGRSVDNRQLLVQVLAGVELDEAQFPLVIDNSITSYRVTLTKLVLPPQVTNKLWATEQGTGPVSITITAYDAEAGILTGTVSGVLASVGDTDPDVTLQNCRFQLFRLETNPGGQ